MNSDQDVTLPLKGRRTSQIRSKSFHLAKQFQVVWERMRLEPLILRYIKLHHKSPLSWRFAAFFALSSAAPRRWRRCSATRGSRWTPWCLELPAATDLSRQLRAGTDDDQRRDTRLGGYFHGWEHWKRQMEGMW